MKWLTGIFVLGCGLACFAQDERNEVFRTQMSRVSDETALKNLPAHLKPEPGKLSLLADFQNQKEGRVTLYLINDSEEVISLTKQDGVISCKREAKTHDGKWRRCDSHQYSWCGNSYSRMELLSARFISWEQKLNSSDGEMHPVRFRLFHGSPRELWSNEGMGRVADEDVRFCRYDAMAMSYGPFEDVAAVTTGEVVEGEDSFVDGDRGVEALGRFTAEKQLFPVLQKTVANLLRQAAAKDLKPDDYGATLRVLSLDRDYKFCLETLDRIIGQTVGEQEAWSYVAGQVNDPEFPWSGLALDWLMDNFEEKKTSKRTLVESVISRPDHRALQSALHAYGGLAEKEEAGFRLAAVSTDSRYSEEDRAAAREAREEMFSNPYLRISFEQGQAFAGKLPRLKSVTLVNIAPQTITLPVQKAEDLVFVRVKGHDELSKRAPVGGSGSLRLKPGEKIVLHDVPWWHGIDLAKVRKSTRDPFADGKEVLLVTLQARTPALWDIPASAKAQIIVERDDLLSAIEADP